MVGLVLTAFVFICLRRLCTRLMPRENSSGQTPSVINAQIRLHHSPASLGLGILLLVWEGYYL